MLCSYPQPAKNLPMARALMTAVRSLDRELSAEIERVTDYGDRLVIRVRHVQGGSGTITLGPTWGRHASVSCHGIPARLADAIAAARLAYQAADALTIEAGRGVLPRRENAARLADSAVRAARALWGMAA